MQAMYLLGSIITVTSQSGRGLIIWVRAVNNPPSLALPNRVLDHCIDYLRQVITCHGVSSQPSYFVFQTKTIRILLRSPLKPCHLHQATSHSNQTSVSVILAEISIKSTNSHCREIHRGTAWHNKQSRHFARSSWIYFKHTMLVLVLIFQLLSPMIISSEYAKLGDAGMGVTSEIISLTN